MELRLTINQVAKLELRDISYYMHRFDRDIGLYVVRFSNEVEYSKARFLLYGYIR